MTTPTALKPWYRVLYIQVIIAVVLGIAVGYVNPSVGKSLKPLGDGFIKLVKMMIAPIIFCTVVHGIASVGAVRGRSLRSFSVRKQAKDHGVTGRIAGALQPGDRVVITEDTVTRGTSPMEAVEAVRAFGAEPVMILVIVDRGGTCADLAEAAGVAFVPMLTARDLGFAYGS